MKMLKCFLVILTVFLSAPAFAIDNWVAGANGNWSDATGTWFLADAPSYVNVENTGATALTTSYTGGATGFVAAATPITGIAVKIGRVNGTTGTMTCALYDVTTTTTVRTVTVNLTDLPSVVSNATNEGGWFVMQLGSTLTPNGTDAYEVRCLTSTGNQVFLWANATSTTTWAQMLINSTTGSPAAADNRVVGAWWTAAATRTNYTITMDNNSSTAFGTDTAAIAPLVISTPGVAVVKGGILNFSVAGATQLRLAANIVVYNGGSFNVGTIASPVPTTTTALLEFVCGTDGDYGLVWRNGGLGGSYGAPRTAGKNVVWTLFTADASAAATTLNVADDTGWKSGDSIAIASNVQFATGEQSEINALTGNAGVSSLAVSAITNAHGGSSGTYTAADGQTFPYSQQNEIILLTRNVKIQSTVTTADAYIYVANTPVVVIAWTEFNHMGGHVSIVGKRGIEVDTTGAGSFSITYSSHHDSRNWGFDIGPTVSNWNNVTIQHVVLWNINSTVSSASMGVALRTGTTNTNWVIDDIVFIRSATSAYGFFIRSTLGTLTNIRGSSLGSAAGGAIYLAASLETSSMLGPFTVHSNKTGASVSLSCGGCNLTIGQITSWRNNGAVWADTTLVATINTLLSWGDGTFGIGSSASTEIKINGGFIASDTTYTVTNCVWWDQILFNLALTNFDISPVQGIFKRCLSDFDNANSIKFTYARVILKNCLSNGVTRFASGLNQSPTSYIAFQNLGRVQGTYLVQTSGGTLTTLSAIYGFFNSLMPFSLGGPTILFMLFGGLKPDAG